MAVSHSAALTYLEKSPSFVRGVVLTHHVGTWKIEDIPTPQNRKQEICDKCNQGRILFWRTDDSEELDGRSLALQEISHYEGCRYSRPAVGGECLLATLLYLVSPRELHHLFLELLVVSDALHRPRLDALRESVQQFGTTTTGSWTHLLSGIECRSDVCQRNILELALCIFHLLS